MVSAADWTVSAIAGNGKGVDTAGVELQIPSGFGGDWNHQWSWSLRWAGDVSYWSARNADSNSSLWNVGLTPVIEFRRPSANGLSYYVDGGIGIRLLSHTRIDDRTLSTAFQFSEYLGAGVDFGDRRQYGVGVRIHHVSNGGIKEPNSGVTFGELLISYRWD